MMGSQPIRIQLGKILWENLAGNSCGKLLWEMFAGKSCRKCLRENLVGNYCRKILWEIACGKCLPEVLAGNVCRKSCGKSCRKILPGNGKCCGKYPIPISKPFLEVIFKICNSSRSTSFSLLKISFLKPILDRFSYMTHQIKA